MGISRRQFVVGSAVVGGGLVLGFSLGGKPVVPGTREGSFQPNAWLQITSDGQFIFQLHKVEMGQGVIGTLPAILCEEFDLDPARLKVEHAGVHPDFFDQSTGGQMTGGSTSTRTGFMPLREAGAAARAMLVASAADQWQVEANACSTDNGVVWHGDQSLSYAELAADASRFADVDFTLKDPGEFKWLGKNMPRPDALAKSTGTAEFGIDVTLPGMKTAVIVRCPHFGGSIQGWDAASVTSMPGVIDCFEMHSGIAIVADTYWQARKAAQQLDVAWDKGPLADLDSAGIQQAQEKALAEQEPYMVVEQGDTASAWKEAQTVLNAEYSAPYTHHSPMEPQNSTALYADGKLDIWSPNQGPDLSQALAAHFTSIDRDNITIHTTLMGGGFGRRGYPDFVGEVAAIAEKLPGTPVKLVWSREDDMRHDFYRVSTLHGIQGAVDDAGNITAWQHTVVATSIIKGMAVSMAARILPDWVPPKVAESIGHFGGNLIARYDPISTDGAHIPYSIPNVSVGQVEYDAGIPSGFWRSVGQSYNVFVVESFIDELANAAGADPLEFRLRYLDQAPRHKAVLELAAEKAGWGKSIRNGGQGIAVAEPFESFCAMVAEVSVDGTNYSLDRVVAAVDCGMAMDPGTIRAQIESAIIYALGAATKPPVTFREGAVEQSNFHDLPVIRMNESPVIEVHIVDSTELPTGIGEIGVPPLAPALGNALFAATGQRLRHMPFKLA